MIETGKWEALKGGAPVFHYDGHGAFGELALLYNCPRAATVRVCPPPPPPPPVDSSGRAANRSKQHARAVSSACQTRAGVSVPHTQTT